MYLHSTKEISNQTKILAFIQLSELKTIIKSLLLAKEEKPEAIYIRDKNKSPDIRERKVERDGFNHDII